MKFANFLTFVFYLVNHWIQKSHHSEVGVWSSVTRIFPHQGSGWCWPFNSHSQGYKFLKCLAFTCILKELFAIRLCARTMMVYLCEVMCNTWKLVLLMVFLSWFWYGILLQFLMVSQQDRLLQDNPPLERSFDTRRKYLDPLNHLQVCFLACKQ